MENNNTGTIDVYRPFSYYAVLRSHSLFIDNQLYSRLKAGEREIVELPAGPHAVRVRMGWTKTNTVTVTVEPGRNHKVLIGRKRITGPMAYLYYMCGALLLVTGIMGMTALSGGVLFMLWPRFGRLHLHTT